MSSEHRRRRQHFRDFTVDDALGQALGDSRLADTASPTNNGLFFCRRDST